MRSARGGCVAEGEGGELLVVHVDTDEDLPEEEKRTLVANMQFARNLNAEVFTIKGKSVAHTAASFVREKRITHVVFGRTAVHGFRKYLYYWAIQHFLKESPNFDVHIVTHPSDP